MEKSRLSLAQIVHTGELVRRVEAVVLRVAVVNVAMLDFVRRGFPNVHDVTSKWSVMPARG